MIPWLTRNDPDLRIYRNRFESFFDRLALKDLSRVDGLLVGSDFTTQMVIEILDPPPGVPVRTVHLAIR